MNCNKCGDKPKSVAEVLGCKTCRDDGTANEIPKDLPADAPLERAVERKLGLGNRFSAEPAEPAPEATSAPARSKKPTR